MSQFNTLSENFQEALRGLGDELKAKAVQQEDDCIKLAHAFVDGPVKEWYAGLADEDKQEVRRVLAEFQQLETKDVLNAMKAQDQDAATPFGFLGSFFIETDAPREADVIEDEGSSRSDENKEAST